MSDEKKRRLAPEELARLRSQTHGEIEGGRGGKPAPLPLASPEPTMPGGSVGGEKRRRHRTEPPTQVDDATVPVPLMEADVGMLSRDGTPPPLPPSPAASAAEVWLEEAVTRPSAFADLASAVGNVPGAPTPGEGTPLLDPVRAMKEAHEQAIRSMRMLLILSTVIAFTVGLILGVLLFRG